MTRQLDVLFVNFNDPHKIYQELANVWTAIEPPTWSLLLANACRKSSFGVAILDCDAERLTYDESIERIKYLNPRLVCAVVYGGNPNSGTTNMEGNLELLRQLKETYPQFKTCVVGSHASALPWDVLSYQQVDFICINEGVRTLKALLNTNLEDGLFDVPGLGHKKNGLYTLNPAQGTVVPQDKLDEEIGGYAWDLLPYDKKPLDLYRAHIWHAEFDQQKRTPFASLYTSTGCLKKCLFCMINIVNREDTSDGVTAANTPLMRYFPTETILREFEKLVDYGVETIRIADELFFLNRRYFEPLLNGLIERGFGDRIRWWSYSRADTCKPQYFDLFKRAGCNFLAIGVEAGNKLIRKENSKGSFEDVDIVKIIKGIEDHGINVISNFIVGLPGDNEKTVQESLDLALEINSSMMNVYPCFALPGSPLHQQAREKGLPLPKKFSEWSFLSYDSLPLPTDHLTSADVLRLRDDFWVRYFTRPEYLSMIERRLGTVAADNIKEMSKIKLKRKLLGD